MLASASPWMGRGIGELQNNEFVEDENNICEWRMAIKQVKRELKTLINSMSSMSLRKLEPMVLVESDSLT